MIRKLLSDYIHTGKNTPIINTKRGRVAGALAWLSMLPLWFNYNPAISKYITGIKNDVIRDMILLLFFFFVFLSQIKHPVKLEKMYYLCPMDEIERRIYLKNAYIFKSCLHSFLILIMCLILYLMCRVNFFAILYILIDGMMYSFLCDVRERKCMIRVWVIRFLSFWSAYLQFVLPSEKLERGDLIWVIGSFIFLLLIELPMFIRTIKSIRKDIQFIATCEEGYIC